MSKIVYLLGAGASCGAIKIAKETGRDMVDLANGLQKRMSLNPILPAEIKEAVKILISDLIDLGGNAEKHATVDTYAKKLFILEEGKKLYKLKCLLSIYFSLNQCISMGECDARYDAFWASLFTNKRELIPDVQVVSWNYDMQLEMSLREYTKNNDIDSAQTLMNAQTNHLSHLGMPDANQKFTVYKLNGCANDCFYLGRDVRDVKQQTLTQDLHKDELIWNIVLAYSKFFEDGNRVVPSICFAWEAPIEDSYYQISFVNEVSYRIKGAQVLVVIGYSFPFFNREVDRAIFQNNMFTDVYIQDINPEPVVESMRSVGIRYSNLYTLPTMKDKFFLPPQL
jgi:hypothetical protein